MTLTETAKITKRVSLACLILAILSLTGWIGYKIYYNNYYLPSLPKIEEQPELKWGVLPKPSFIQNSISSSNYSYSLDTETGDLPSDFPKLLKVYFIPQLGTTLLASDKSKSLAKSFNFINGPDLTSPTLYKYTDVNNNNFEVDLNTGNFKFQRIVATDSARIQNPNFKTTEDIAANFKSFLADRGLLTDSLRNGKNKTTYESLPSGEQTATVSLWQENIDDLPIETAQYNSGIVKAILNDSQDVLNRYLSLEYFYWGIDKQTSSTYPLKTIGSAFNELKSGGGVVLVEPKTPKVSVAKAYLAYYLPLEYTPYLQPIYVFEGENFVGYVAAIKDEYLK